MGPQTDAIIAALEATAKDSRKPPRSVFDIRKVTVSRADTVLYRDQLLRFLRELPEELSVTEIVEGLEAYGN